MGTLTHLTGVNLLTSIHAAPAVAAAGMYPNLNGVGGAGQLKTVIGALMTIVLIVAVLMMIVCAATWALASAHGNYQTATKARTGCWSRSARPRSMAVGSHGSTSCLG